MEETREDAPALMDVAASEADERALDTAPEAEVKALEASDARLLAPDETADPAELKMVVEPTTEVNTEPPEEMTELMAEVVMADPAAESTLLATPPAPAKMVVEPMIEVRTDEPSVIKDSIADVVIADPRAPPWLVVVAVAASEV